MRLTRLSLSRAITIARPFHQRHFPRTVPGYPNDVPSSLHSKFCSIVRLRDLLSRGGKGAGQHHWEHSKKAIMFFACRSNDNEFCNA